MKGLRNAIRTEAEAWIPGVCVNRSTEIPRRKPIIGNDQWGVSKGKSRIKMI